MTTTQAPTRTRRIALCTMAATPASVPALRHFARRLTGGWGLGEDVQEALALVVTELTTNVLLHSGSPHVALLLAADRHLLTGEVRDAGRWLARSTHRRAAADAGVSCGRGLRLVEAYAPDCTVLTDPTGTRVVVRIPIGVLPEARTAPA
ncbi:ATP-binding protein [Streptomyces sp. NPDC055815]